MNTTPAKPKRIRRTKLLVASVTFILLLAGIVRFGPNALAVAFNSDRIIHEAKKARVADDLRTIEQAIDIYRKDNNNRIPERLAQLLDKNENDIHYFKCGRDGPPRDPWENEYIYQPNHDNKTYQLASYGQDGAPGGEGRDADISLASMNNNVVK
ncbi:MAG: type II secretion system protein GspG [Planctomycetota bacterium]